MIAAILRAILRVFADLFQSMHKTLVKWELRFRFRNFSPKFNTRKLTVEEIDMGNCGRWQATDDARIPKAHTSVNVNDYIYK